MAVVLRAYVLSEQERFLWYTDEETDFFVTSYDSIPTFLTSSDATQYATANQLAIADCKVPSLSLDRVIEWVQQKDYPEPQLLWDAWNLLYEVAHSVPGVGQEFLAQHRKHVGLYKRLFWGLNLPAATPEGEHFSPEWSDSEKLTMAEHLASGIDLFFSVATPASNPEASEKHASDI